MKIQLFVVSHPSFCFHFCNHPNHQKPSMVPSLEHGRPGTTKKQSGSGSCKEGITDRESPEIKR
jgi:hypothetical protein